MERLGAMFARLVVRPVTPVEIVLSDELIPFVFVVTVCSAVLMLPNPVVRTLMLLVIPLSDCCIAVSCAASGLPVLATDTVN